MASKRNKRYQPPNSPGQIVSGFRLPNGKISIHLFWKHPDFSAMEKDEGVLQRRARAKTVKGITGQGRVDSGAVKLRQRIESLRPSTPGEAA
jgi:hypothetical protein